MTKEEHEDAKRAKITKKAKEVVIAVSGFRFVNFAFFVCFVFSFQTCE